MGITAVKTSKKSDIQNNNDISSINVEYDKANCLIKYNGREVKYDKERNSTVVIIIEDAADNVAL